MLAENEVIVGIMASFESENATFCNFRFQIAAKWEWSEYCLN